MQVLGDLLLEGRGLWIQGVDNLEDDEREVYTRMLQEHLILFEDIDAHD